MLGGLVLLTLLLGAWQCQRGMAKLALAAAASDAQRQAPAAWSGGALPPVGTRILPKGNWVPEHAFVLAPRSRQGQPGVEVITPYRLNDGETLLVNRGWLAEGRAMPALPSATPTVELAPWPRFITLGPTLPEGNRFQHVDPDAYARWRGGSRPVGYAYAVASPGLIVDLPRPYLNAERHFAYMASWWGMTLAGAALCWRFRKETK